MYWDANLCRICGLIGETAFPIFPKDSTHALEMKLKKYLNLNVLKDDFKPKQICGRCLGKVEAFVEFIDMCYASDEKFDGILYEAQTQQVLTQQQKWSGVKGDVNMTPEDTFNDCPDLIMIVNYKNGMADVNQEMLNIVNASDTFNTADITYGYEQNATVLRHSGKYKSYQNKNQENIAITPKDAFLIDDNKNKDITNVKKQLISVDAVKDAVLRNVDETARKNTKTTTNKNVKTHTCKECGRSFARKLNLEAHMAVHTNIRPHSCNVCNKSFAMKWELTKHQRLHTNLYQCELCSKAFTGPSKLERHIRTHTNERPFVCPVRGCGKSFTDKGNLIGHQIVHTDKRDFQCDVCEKRYKRKKQLNDHKRAHAEESEFKCEFCTKSYRWKRNLRLHLRKHDSYKCVDCDKDCEKFSALIKHGKECKSGRNIG